MLTFLQSLCLSAMAASCCCWRDTTRFSSSSLSRRNWSTSTALSFTRARTHAHTHTHNQRSKHTNEQEQLISSLHSAGLHGTYHSPIGQPRNDELSYIAGHTAACMYLLSLSLSSSPRLWLPWWWWHCHSTVLTVPLPDEMIESITAVDDRLDNGVISSLTGGLRPVEIGVIIII